MWLVTLTYFSRSQRSNLVLSIVDSHSTTNNVRIIKLGFQLPYFRARHVIHVGSWPWPTFHDHRGQMRHFRFSSLAQQLIWLGSSNFVSSFTIYDDFRAQIMLYALWSWPTFQGQRGNILYFWYWTLARQLIKLESSYLVSSFTILGHICYVIWFHDLDLLFKVTEVKFDVLVFGLWQQIKLGLPILIMNFHV